MAKKGDRTVKEIAGNPAIPGGMHCLLSSFIDALRIRDYSSGTIQKHRLQLNHFVRWCESQKLFRPSDLTRKVIQAYQYVLVHQIDKRGNQLSIRNQYGRICSIRCWFTWLVRNEHVPCNPATDLDTPKLGHRLPKHVLSRTEAERVLKQPNTTQRIGLRDRAILETFYSTGIRRMELVHLQLCDLDTGRRVLTVRMGKGKKDRVVPIGLRAIGWIDRYLARVRPGFISTKDNQSLFLTRMGDEFSGSTMSKLVRDYVDAAAIGKTGSCHLFRHTMATLMLEGGADVRYIQAMLGHRNLETTQVYTRVSIRKLQQVHTKTHPAKPSKVGQFV